jgi:hypothetical protein
MHKAKQGGAPQTPPNANVGAGSTGQEGGHQHVLTANDLRRLAESADGQRGTLLQLDAERAGGRMTRAPSNTEPPTGAILVKTPMKNPDRPIPARVDVIASGSGKSVTLDTLHYDSIFWGEAAAEKFLVPYYVRFCSEPEIAALREAIENGNVLAIAHVYPTFWEGIEEALHVLDAREPFFDMGFITLATWLASQ